MIDRSIAFPWVWLNGKLTRAANANVSIFDRSFTLGDGIFDTLRILDTCPLQWRAHWGRFCRTAREFGFKIPATQTEILTAVQELLRRNKCVNAVARIQLSRGTSPRGYSPVHAHSPVLIITLHSVPQIIAGSPKQWKLGVATLPFPNCPLSSANKTASRIFNVAVKMEADRAGFDDALILNCEGRVAEAISSNVFWMTRGMVFTPPLTLGILPGTTRTQVLNLCRRNAIRCVEKSALLGDVLKSDAVFLSVSTAGIIEVVRIGQTELKRHSMTAQLHAGLEQLHHRESRRFVRTR